MKFGELDKVQSDKLNSINVSDLVRKKKYLFVGKCNDKLIKKLKTSASGRELIMEFLNKLQKAYVDTASYLQTKYAINNKVLKYLSAIDPSARGHCLTHSYLKELYDYFAPFIKVVDGSDYGLEITCRTVRFLYSMSMIDWMSGGIMCSKLANIQF